MTAGNNLLTWDVPAVTHLFDTVRAYLINLESRHDRWEQSKHLPFIIERFPATAHEHGWKGLNLTMHDLFTTKFTGQPMLVFEDDAQMVRDKIHFDLALENLPEDFDMLMLGANIKDKVERVSEHICRVRGAWTTHAVYYSPKIIQHLIEILPTLDTVIDEYFRTTIHPQGNSYVVRPMVCYQRPSYSDLMQADQDYTGLFETSNSMLF